MGQFGVVANIAYLMLLPLALTSPKLAKRRLGARRWKQLHRLVYLISPLAGARYWAAGFEGRGYTSAIVFTSTMAILLGLRLYWHVQRPHASSANGARG